MVVLGPGSVAETTGNWRIMYGAVPVLATRDLLVASRPASVDAFSYHHYGATSIRCASTGMQTTADAALSEGWLRRTDETFAFYKALRDEFAPGKTLWLTETADAACGGQSVGEHIPRTPSGIWINWAVWHDRGEGCRAQHASGERLQSP
jgi:hypothetical protein